MNPQSDQLHKQPGSNTPDLKWLLNERAAVAGEVTKATIRSHTLAVKLEAPQQQVSRLGLTAQAARRT
jgi:hypothetical protein